MVNNSKTPVMVLQELTVKLGLPPPEYNIIYAATGTHENEFHYQVLTSGVCAVGFGRSKQVAKHDAARKALELLAKGGTYVPDKTPIKSPGDPFKASSVTSTVNALGILCDLCNENKISNPTFTEISDVGPPHCREFTYQCQVSAIVTRGIAGTKKQAKQIAASEMLERLKNVLHEVIAECKVSETDNKNAIMPSEEQAIESYKQLRTFSKPKQKANLGVHIKEYDRTIKNIINERNLTYQDLEPYFDGCCTEERFAELLQLLDVDYAVEQIRAEPEVVVLSLNLDTPFSVIGIEDGKTSASNNAIFNAFDHLKILAK